MNPRTRDWRRHQKDRVIKSRMKSRAHTYVINYSSYGRRNNKGIRIYFTEPESIWFNEMGKFLKDIKTSTGYASRWWYDTDWKEKYDTKRARQKEVIRKELNDEVGEKYHIKY